MQKLLLLLLLALATANTGCATHERSVLFRTQGTAPHDPPRGRDLFEQIPPWDDATIRRCGSHLRPEDRRPGMTMRC